MPDGLVFAQYLLFVSILGPVYGDYLAKELTVIHVEDGMFPILIVLVLDQGYIFGCLTPYYTYYILNFAMHTILVFVMSLYGLGLLGHHYLIDIAKRYEGCIKLLFSHSCCQIPYEHHLTITH